MDSGAFIKRMRFSFENLALAVLWEKVELFHKNSLKRSVLKSQFQNPRNLDEKDLYFYHSRKNNLKFTMEQKVD